MPLALCQKFYDGARQPQCYNFSAHLTGSSSCWLFLAFINLKAFVQYSLVRSIYIHAYPKCTEKIGILESIA
ncbi:hypothetical protein Y032_0067g93 [Ancylostoma ceylanicum]|uniref:Uncharacterized protein n=1 Tax=Ancylostoma ceylanicum TaxID=53326 RepID=A0A016TZS1_9BILA|nr:hypothetical protein Y032_0067g93 [Ancylostoma ceylanicum]